MANFTSIFTGNQIESRLANYGECDSSIDGSIKSVTLTQINNRDVNFELFAGATVRVKFNNANSSIAPLLNVNNTGAKPIILFGNTPAGDTVATSWQEGSIVSFTYDSESWVMNNYREAGSTEPVPEEVITEYTYTYNGDRENEGLGWVYNYGGIKVFAKMGDIPEGTLNLVGSTIFRTNPSNQWLDKTFTITEEHLSKVLNKSSTDIPATQDGLIQIYDIMASDFSEFTVLCICTKPGWYNVCFDDWFEVINFTETGIFAYEKRTYGGNDYLATFTFTATTITDGSSNNTGTGSGSNNTNVTDPTKYTGNEIEIFTRGICIGDSVTEGSFDNAQGGAVIKKYSYPKYLERMSGISIANAGIAGMTSQTWYEASLDSTTAWGTWVNQEWVWNTDPQNTGNDVINNYLDYWGFDFAIIHIGINDLAPLYDGSKTIDEILINFETYMNNIIWALKNANKGIRIFLATIIPSYATPGNAAYGALNDAIKAIADYTDYTYLLDLNKYSECASHPAYNVTHPTSLGYKKIASEIYAMISYIINKNLDDFKTVQYIGTDYTIE